MNCANHPDRPRVAFCQNCGKPLCEECRRVDGASIFCEPCFAARNAGPPPGYAGGPYAPPAAGYVPGAPRPARHAEPVLAALLGLIPGVGAMYNEQFVKGIVHLIVFAILISLASDVNGIFGILIPGWVLYMAFEAYHTARARRDGTPLPNPFGLNDLGERLGFGKAWPAASSSSTPNNGSSVPPYDPAAQNPFPQQGAADTQVPPAAYVVPPATHWGAPYDVPPVAPIPPVAAYPDAPVPHRRNIPAGAVWLIVIGLFFLLGHASVFHIFHGRLFGPFVLIGIGIWIFVRRMMETGHSIENDGSDFYRWRLTHALNGAAWMVLAGVLWMLDALRVLRWSQSWPVFLIAAGVLAIFRRTVFSSGHGPVPPYGAAAVEPTPSAPVAPVTSTEIVPADPSHFTRADHDDREEGR